MEKNYLSLLYMLNNETNQAKRKEIINYLIKSIEKNQKELNEILLNLRKEKEISILNQ